MTVGSNQNFKSDHLNIYSMYPDISLIYPDISQIFYQKIKLTHVCVTYLIFSRYSDISVIVDIVSNIIDIGYIRDISTDISRIFYQKIKLTHVCVIDLIFSRYSDISVIVDIVSNIIDIGYIRDISTNISDIFIHTFFHRRAPKRSIGPAQFAKLFHIYICTYLIKQEIKFLTSFSNLLEMDSFIVFHLGYGKFVGKANKHYCRVR